MRYLHNYKGTTLPLQADGVKNWLLSFSFGFFFSYPTIQKGDIRQRWGIHLVDTLKHPALWKAFTTQKGQIWAGETQEAGTSFSMVSIYKGSLAAAAYEQTWHTRISTHGQNAAAVWGTLGSINLHPAEMCEAGRLRGGQWCRLHQGGHLGSMMLSYVPAASQGEGIDI